MTCHMVWNIDESRHVAVAAVRRAAVRRAADAAAVRRVADGFSFDTIAVFLRELTPKTRRVLQCKVVVGSCYETRTKKV